MQQLMHSTSELDEGSQPVELPETSDIPRCWIQQGVCLSGSARRAFRWVFITAVSNPVGCYRSSPCAGKKNISPPLKSGAWRLATAARAILTSGVSIVWSFYSQSQVAAFLSPPLPCSGTALNRRGRAGGSCL